MRVEGRQQQHLMTLGAPCIPAKTLKMPRKEVIIETRRPLPLRFVYTWLVDLAEA